MAVTRLPALPLLLALLALLSACGTGQSLRPVETDPEGFLPWQEQVPAYRFGPGDRFSVKFLLVPEMDDEVTVAPDGTIGLRIAGQVQAAGLTAQELADEIEERAGRWMLDPSVSIGVIETPSNRVYVGGSVIRPGPYLINGRLGALEAIMLAGGFDREARYEEVVLIRRSPDDRPMLRTVDLRDFIQTGGSPGEVPLVAGDIVFVPRSSIAEVNLWVEQFITRVLPFDRTFNYSISRQGPLSRY